MSISNFKIAFDNPHETFFCGEIVSGNLSFSLAKEKKLKGVTITFEGLGESKWQDRRTHTNHQYRNNQHSNNQVTVVTTHHLQETYLQQALYVAGSPGQEITLPPGDYTYPFRYALPLTIPSSFEGEFGFVRYVVRANLIRPWRFDHKCKRAFTVICPLDLNRVPGIQDGFQIADEKTLCCWCCASAPITLAVVLPCRGFVPGQQPKAIVELDNPTTSTVTVKCHLVQIVQYISPNGQRYEVQKIMAKENLGTAEKKGSLSKQTELRVPALPASMMQFCNCLDVSYALQFMGEVSGAHGSAAVNIPVTIGTIPLISTISMIAVGAGSSMDPMGPTAPQMDPAAQQANPFAQYPQMPPPSYQETVMGKANIKGDDDSHVQGDMQFAPRYPMYNFQ